MKIAVKRLIRDERGQLNLVLVLLVVSGLIIASLLGLMSTGLITGQAYENKMHALYAADAGVEDGLWQIKNVELAEFLGGYDEYDYYSQWPYSLNESVNDYSVDVTIANVWMPKDISAPYLDTAREIAEDTTLIITGGPSHTVDSTYEIKISYQWECGDDLLLDVNTIGIWLPPGFAYAGNCSLKEEDYYSEPQIDAYKGGYAVVWDFASVPLEDFPGTNGPPMIKSFTFEYTGPEGQSPHNAVSWIDTSGVPDITYTWDADVKIYSILSVAGDCEVEAYSTKIEVRKLGSAISGDYHAIGNTLMSCQSAACPHYRNRLFKESSATVAEGNIPSTATIEAAWLYWSGWIEEAPGGELVIWGPEDCNDFWAPIMDWDRTFGSAWDTYYGRFRGTGYNKAPSARYLTMGSSIDLSAYAGQTVEVSWEHDEDGSLEGDDCLYFAFSSDGGNTWSEDFVAFCDDLSGEETFVYEIPQEYLTSSFRMRFYLYGFGAGWWGSPEEYCFIDNIEISVMQSLMESTKVNRVMFNGSQITTDQWQVEYTPDAGEPPATGGENSWCYSCFYDATDIVIDALDPDTKSGTFTLGHVLEGTGTQLYYPSGAPDGTTGYPLATPAQSSGPGGYGMQYMWTYAGWSLIIIYSSPVSEGHQLYLFDDLRYVAVHTTMDFPISGFLVPDPVEDEEYAAHITCFVGDGDEHWAYDFIALLDAEPSVPSYEIDDDYKLWDGITCNHNSESSPNNVWNSQSVGIDTSGVDIDTFDITWSSALLEPGDTSAWVILGNDSSNPMDAELIMVVYIIISFRSETTTGGIISYLINI